nr:MAG TPA: protein of unknown function DUF761 [Caudoviricetes sp.]
MTFWNPALLEMLMVKKKPSGILNRLLGLD